MIKEIKHFQMDVLSFTEIKNNGKYSEQLDKYSHLYSGVGVAGRVKAVSYGYQM